MNSKTLLVIAMSLSCLGLACEPKQGTTSPEPSTEPAPAAEPAPAEPAADDAAAPDDAAANKCVADGGTCTNKTATVACARFEEGPEWGCTEANTGCCLQ
jgi:hypothetical protein